MGNQPEGLAFDPRTGLLAVGLRNPDRVAIVDGKSGRVRRRVRLPESPRHLQLAGPGGPVLVAVERANAVVEVSLPDGRLRRTRVGRFPHDATGAGGRIWVADELGDTVSVVEQGRRVRVLDAPVQPGGVAATRDERRIGVVGVRARALQAYDARRVRPLGRIDVGIGPTHLVGDERRLFVVDTRGNGLLWVDLEPELRVHRRTHLQGAPYGIAHDVRRRRFWVTLTATNRVAEVTDRRLLRSFPTVRQPNSVAVNPGDGRVFVASRAEGTLQLLDPPR